MGRHRIRAVVLAIGSLILISVPASRDAYAAPAPSVNAGKAPSSGIGLAANLTAKGIKVLSNATYYERALKSSLWEPTPDGLIYQSCMYHVPNHSYVDSIHGRITLPGGKVLTIKPCPYPRLDPPGAAPAAKSTAATGGTLSGNTQYWVDGFEADNLPHMYYLSANLAAPYPPNNGINVSALMEYQWTALGSVSTGTLLQPALGWGKLSVSNWRAPLAGDVEMASYYLWGFNNAVAGPFYSVNPLDTVHVGIQGYNCGSGGGDCTWWMQIADVNTGQNSQLTVGSSPVFTSVIGELESNAGSLGAYGANCQSLFANHHLVWRNLTVEDQSGANVTPTSYYETGWNDPSGPGWTVFSDSNMVTSAATTNGQTAADTTWSNSCGTF